MKKFSYDDDANVRDFVINAILTGVTSVDTFKGRFDRFDLKYLPKNAEKERFMELKRRHFDHDKYPTTFIEKDKYDAITGCTAILADVDLLVLFDDGWICYTPSRLKEAFNTITVKPAPDQWQAHEDKWCVKEKEFAEIFIKEGWFKKYE